MFLGSLKKKGGGRRGGWSGDQEKASEFYAGSVACKIYIQDIIILLTEVPSPNLLPPPPSEGFPGEV